MGLDANQQSGPRRVMGGVLRLIIAGGNNGAVPPSLEDLRRRRDEIAALARRRGATRVSVFGSVARGEAGPTSDVDLLVEFEPGRSLLDQVHLIDELGDLLGTPVDVVARGGLLDRDAHILDEAVPL